MQAFSFKGRVGRMTYFLCLLGYGAIDRVVTKLAETSDVPAIVIAAILFEILIFYLGAALQVKRLRDIGWHWALVFINAPLVIANDLNGLYPGNEALVFGIGATMAVVLNLACVFKPTKPATFEGVNLDGFEPPARTEPTLGRSGGPGFQSWCLIAALAATLLVGASSANAAMKEISRVGSWTMFAGTATDNDKPMCQMTSTNDIRAVHIKWQPDGYYVHVVKDNWNVPSDIRMPLAVRFDQEEPFTGKATSIPNWPKWISLKLDDADVARRFLDQFSAADRMTINFGGSEREWVMRMNGSDAILPKFAECIAAVNKKYGGANATQPFDKPDKPATSPFADMPQPDNPSQRWLPAPPPKKVPTKPYRVTPRGFERTI
jgi:uncharacterized membrane protein YhaH (DUF805 family)